MRDVMIEGDSGILAISPKWNKPIYQSSKRRLTWPNGAIATTFSADKPDRLRGPQHDAAWLDELAAWRYPESLDQLKFGLRLGAHPQCVITTTPRPIPVVKELARDPKTFITKGTTYDNAQNLAPSFLNSIIKKYEGTRLGRQELNAEILDDNPNALWQRSVIDNLRVKGCPELIRIVIGVDPAVTANPNSDETGIVIVGLGVDGHAYVLNDLSLSDTPNEWGKKIVEGYKKHHADRVIAETNNGGALIEALLRSLDQNISYKGIHAKRGKYVRAEPVAALYEQGRVHHVGSFPHLEDQMCDYDPLTYEESPDRLDALVYAITELMFKKEILIDVI